MGLFAPSGSDTPRQPAVAGFLDGLGYGIGGIVERPTSCSDAFPVRDASVRHAPPDQRPRRFDKRLRRAMEGGVRPGLAHTIPWLMSRSASGRSTHPDAARRRPASTILWRAAALWAAMPLPLRRDPTARKGTAARPGDGAAAGMPHSGPCAQLARFSASPRVEAIWSICPSSMISGGDRAMVSPVTRISTPFSRQSTKTS